MERAVLTEQTKDFLGLNLRLLKRYCQRTRLGDGLLRRAARRRPEGSRQRRLWRPATIRLSALHLHRRLRLRGLPARVRQKGLPWGLRSGTGMRPLLVWQHREMLVLASRRRPGLLRPTPRRPWAVAARHFPRTRRAVAVRHPPRRRRKTWQHSLPLKMVAPLAAWPPRLPLAPRSLQMPPQRPGSVSNALRRRGPKRRLAGSCPSWKGSSCASGPTAKRTSGGFTRRASGTTQSAGSRHSCWSLRFRTTSSGCMSTSPWRRRTKVSSMWWQGRY
mmetsp:Transcript_107462/g.302393  ORF Transcript_107462/g.302393 Transcript_107462/m.302393 type:complete len:275 (-) Transcript_107462:281-1105(-)